MSAPRMVIGGKYNWKNQPERLVYLGQNWSGNGYWHQFEKLDAPGVVWCEVLTADLSHFEETRPTPVAPTPAPLTGIQRWNADVDARKAAKRAAQVANKPALTETPTQEAKP